MMIQVHLMGMLKSKNPDNNALELTDGATIEQALIALDIPIDSVQVFTVNGQLIRDRTYPLSADDELSVLPPVGGG
jgi:sulfur carrier protein ThiS